MFFDSFLIVLNSVIVEQLFTGQNGSRCRQKYAYFKLFSLVLDQAQARSQIAQLRTVIIYESAYVGVVIGSNQKYLPVQPAQREDRIILTFAFFVSSLNRSGIPCPHFSQVRANQSSNFADGLGCEHP